MLENIKKYILKDDYIYYSFVIAFCLLLPATILFSSLYLISLFIFVFSITKLSILTYKDNKIQKVLYIQKDMEQKINETNEYRTKIQKIFDSNFKESEFNNIFDKKIFTIIEMLSELNNNNLNGEAQYRVQKIINNSLKIYLINIESSAKMIIAHNDIDMNFREEILNLLNQNKLIIEKLKEFVTKLLLLNVNTKEFNELIFSFENSIKSLDIIKKIREGN